MPTIQEYLEVPADWPVVEKIKHDIVLMPNRRDIKMARQHDPVGCALHNAACRIFDVPNAAIGGRWAYIPQRNAKGKYYIARMQATRETQRAIRKFDRTGEMPEGGFVFAPIAPSHQFKKKAAYNRKWNAGEVGHKDAPRDHKKHRRVLRSIPHGVHS